MPGEMQAEKNRTRLLSRQGRVFRQLRVREWKTALPAPRSSVRFAPATPVTDRNWFSGLIAFFGGGGRDSKITLDLFSRLCNPGSAPGVMRSGGGFEKLRPRNFRECHSRRDPGRWRSECLGSSGGVTSEARQPMTGTRGRVKARDLFGK